MIRAYHSATDEAALLNLWAGIFGETWPLDSALLGREAINVPTYLPGDHLLAEVDGQVVGFALTQVSHGKPDCGSLLALGVHPAYRRRGLGRALHAAALARLRERGAEWVQLSAGALGYLWPGVPVDQPAAFEVRGNALVPLENDEGPRTAGAKAQLAVPAASSGAKAQLAVPAASSGAKAQLAVPAASEVRGNAAVPPENDEGPRTAGAPAAWPFFSALGWPEVERSFDLVRGLDDYQTPAWVWERVNAQGLSIIQATPGDETRALDFIAREEPGWARFYEQAFREGRAADVILAQDSHGDSANRPVPAAVLGAALAENALTRWSQRFDPPVGAPGCILTAEAARERGIGMALSARASEILKERGCHTAFIGWTWLVDWYGKLGYRAWQEYAMSWTRLERLEMVQAMQDGRARLAEVLSGAPIDRPVLTNGWTVREWLIHLGGWEQRIADCYQALIAGRAPKWELDQMSLDELNALMLRESPDSSYDAARAGEERACLRLLEIARSAPDADLFDQARFAWMKSVPFAEWIRNNTYEHMEEHLLDWIGEV